MKYFKIILVISCLLFPKLLYAKNPSDLINEIVNDASKVLSSDDPVESKIIIDIDQAQPYLKSSISYFISASTTNNTTFWNNIL